MIGVGVIAGKFHLLGKSTATADWTRVPVHDAKCSGRDTTVFLNAELLNKALVFGLTRIELIDARSPVRFSAGGQQMIISPLRADAAPAATTPPPPAIPAAAQTNPPPQPAEQTKEETPMPATNGNTTGAKSAIPHLELVTQVEHTIRANGLAIGTQAHSLSHEGMRYFGLMEIQRKESDEDFCWVLGLRNSHDKTFPAGIVAGAQVLICDNLAFSGEVKLARKHTTHITRDLPRLVQGAVGRLMDRWHHQDTRLMTYKVTEIEVRTAHDLIVRATDVGVCPNQLIPRVLHEWREPRHETFAPRNAWSLFNAFTEALKGNLVELPRRTEALHGLLDMHVALHSKS